MADTLTNGTVVPDASDRISTSGVSEMRTLGSSVDVSLGAKLEDSDLDAVRAAAFNRGALPANTDTRTYLSEQHAGLWHIRSQAAAAGMVGLPDGLQVQGEFLVLAGGPAAQMFFPYGFYGAGPQYRSVVDASTNEWSDWGALGSGGGAGDSVGPWVQNHIRKAMFMDAMGGPIDTGGKAAVALRFDHGLLNFRDKVLPLTKARGLKVSQAYNPRNWHYDENQGVNASDLNSWVADGDVEIWNHSANHLDASDESALEDTIVGGLAEIEAELPAARGNVWGFAPPGVDQTNGYGGFGNGNTPEKWDTTAGRLILQHHAVSSAYLPGTSIRALDGTPRDGLAHITMDSITVNRIKQYIDDAISQKRGVQLMLHPSRLDADGYLSSSQLTNVLDYIVERRDAGDLVTLSPYELLAADSTVASREPIVLTTEDLNDITTPGDYSQSVSAEALLSRNYPVERAARITVQANPSRSQVTQMLWTYDATANQEIWVRNFYVSWGEWKQIPLGGNSGDDGSWAATEIGEAHLDDVTAPGVHWQSFSSYATEAQGYPYPRAGHLIVTGNELGTQVTQRYVTFDATANIRYSLRNFYSSWDEWRDIPLDGQDSGGGGGEGLLHGTVEDGTDVNTLTAPGFYSVPTTAVAGTLVNWPTNRGGVLIVGANTDSNVTSQKVIAHVSSTAPNEEYTRTKLLSSTTSWSEWNVPDWVKGRLPVGTNADDWRVLGGWMVVNASDATGLPGSGQGLLEVAYLTGAGVSLQRFTERVANDDVQVWHRYSLLVGGWAGIEWSLVGGSGGDAGGSARVSDVQVSDHASRVEIARSRRGGGIGTSGKPVFMWRFDHWLVAFRDKILPVLREFDLPATLNVNYDNLSNPQNGGGSITWADVQAWNQYDGIEIANHGATHTNASTMESIFHEVVEGRRLLEAAMPRVAVETWQEHGSAYLVASDLPGDEGLDIGREPHNFTESYAGRLIMAEHAVVEGKFGSFYPPLTGSPQIGQSHYSLDRDTAASSIETIQYAQQVGRGLTGYTHPGLMDQVNVDGSLIEATYNADGSVDFDGTHYATEAEFRTAQDAAGNIVHMPTKDFRAICEWLAAERDAERLMVMTAAGGGFADKRSNHRENVFLPRLSDWSATSGWTETGEGATQVWASTSAATRVTQILLLYTRFGWAMGAGHEMIVWAKADVETTLLLRLEEYGNAANWATAKNHTVPGDGVLRPYRLPLTLPRDRAITQMRALVGGPSMEIHGPPVLAAI